MYTSVCVCCCVRTYVHVSVCVCGGAEPQCVGVGEGFEQEAMTVGRNRDACV